MQTVKLNPADNVAIARIDIEKDAVIQGLDGLKTCMAIPAMHKLATSAIGKGKPIQKYNQLIGVASRDITPGEHVHSHNCVMVESTPAHEFCQGAVATDYVPDDLRSTFSGYRRAGGKAGTRNYVAVLTTVNCSATVAQQIALQANRYAGMSGEYANVDGVAAFVHSTGCGMRASGEGLGYGDNEFTPWQIGAVY